MKNIALNKKTFIIIGIITLVVIILMIVFYYVGKSNSDKSYTPPPTDLVGQDLPVEMVNKLDSLAVQLYKDMEGVNMNWEYDLYEEVSLLSDSELVSLSNLFNDKYQKESGETFLDWLKNENFSWGSFSLSTITNTIIKRLSGLGVK